MKYDIDIHVLKCPHCMAHLHKNINKRKSGKWKCYSCKKEVDTPKIDKRKRIINKKQPFDESTLMDKYDIIKALNKYTADPYKLNQKDIRNVAFIAFLYLVAPRRSEVIGIKKEGKYVVQPIRKGQINVSSKFGLKVIDIDTLPVLKRRSKGGVHPIRNLSIILDHEKQLIKYFWKWYKMLPNDDAILFDFSPSTAWRICNNILGKYPHFLRHSRLSDLVKIYDFKDSQLQHYVGWQNSQMASRYTHLSSDDLLKTMISSYDMKRQALKKA